MKKIFVFLLLVIASPAFAQYQTLISSAPTNGTNEIQRITFGGTAVDSTTFKLAWNGRVTSSILWTSDGDADLDTAIQHALIPIFGANNTQTVIGTLSSGVGYVNVTFIGAYAKKPVGGTMTVSVNNTSGTIAVTKPTPGVMASYRSAVSGAELIETDIPAFFRNTSTTQFSPTWTNVTTFNLGLSSLSQGDLVYGSATDTWAQLAKNTSATRYLSNTGSSNNPAWAQVNVTNGITGAVPIANGGTASTTGPAALAALGWQFPAPLAADTATTGQALVGCPTALQFTIGTAGTYHFRAVLQVGNSGTNGTKIGILVPASATVKAYVNGNTSGITAYTSDIISASTTAGANFNTSAISTAVITVEGDIVSGGTGGQVVIQFLATTSGTATVKAGSTLWAVKTL